MPSFELSKLQGVSPPRALGESDRAQLQARQGDLPAAPRPANERPGVSVEVSQTQSAGKPPVNNERVSEIRDALRNGSYPLVPAQIADAMIAARVSFAMPQGKDS